MNRMNLAAVLALSALVVSTAGAQQTQQQAGPSAGADAVRTLNKGTTIKVKTSEQMSSQTNKVGDHIKAAITDDVKDGNGQVIFPAGSLAQLDIVQTSTGPGFAIGSVEVNGKQYSLKSSAMNPSAGQPSGGSGQSTAWNVFRKNKDGTGYVSDSKVKEPPVGTDFVIPPGTTVTFEFGNETVSVTS